MRTLQIKENIKKKKDEKKKEALFDRQMVDKVKEELEIEH